MNSQQFLADAISNELDRLGVSTNQDPYSGLMADYRSLLVEGNPDVIVIEISDDYGSGLYEGQRLLGHLKAMSLGDVDLNSDSPINVWQSIQSFQL